MIEYLRERRILLPAAVTLERIALAARALARKRAHKSLVEGLSPRTTAGLEALLLVAKDGERTPLAWLREWPEAPRQRNLVLVVGCVVGDLLALFDSAGYAVAVDDVGEHDRPVPREWVRHGREISGHGIIDPARLKL